MTSRLYVLFTVLSVATVACSGDPEKLKREYLASGDRFFAQKSYLEAIVQYRNAVAQDGAFGEARFKLADAYAESGDLRNALREYVRAADLLPKDVEAQLRAGNGLLAAGQYPEAKARALAALGLDPKNSTGLILLGNSMAGLKDLDGAIEQIDDAIESDPHRVLSYTNLGELQLAKGNRAAAEAAFKRAVEVNPQSEPAHLALANYYWASNQRDQAERELKTALEIAPKSLSANRALALFYAFGNRASESERYLKTYADLSPDVEPKLILADSYIVKNDSERAQAVLQPLLNTREGFAPANLRLAAIDFAAGRRPKAYQAIEDVLKREPRNEEALLEKGRFLMVERKSSETLVLANSVVAANPNSVPGHFLKGMALAAAENTDRAIETFQEVLRLRPSATPALVQLARLNLLNGNAAAAVEFLNQAIKQQPNLGLAHLLLAKSLLALGKLDAAAPEVMALASSNRSSADAQTLLADFYWKKGDNRRAKDAYDQAYKLQGASVEALKGLVRADLVQQDFASARSRVERQLVSAPDDEALLILAGNTYLATNDVQKAESMFRHLLQVNPSNIDAYARLGVIYASQNRLDEARKEFEELSHRQPKAAVTATTMAGVILTLQQKGDEARKQYERALELDPRTPVAANNLAWDYAENGRNLDIALQLAQTAKARLPNNASVSGTLGWVYYKKGMPGPAVASLEEAIRQAPTAPSTHYRLGLAYLLKGDRTKARGSFEQALKLNSEFKEAADAKRVLATLKG